MKALKNFYEPGHIAIIKQLLRRTLLLHQTHQHIF